MMPQVLHKVGAERAAAAVIALDTPGANYRTVWALSKHFPHVKTFVRAHDVDHGMNLEKAGATAVGTFSLVTYARRVFFSISAVEISFLKEGITCSTVLKPGIDGRHLVM